ncbi:MAG: ComEC/Rec2 family competence protein [Candidatus Omnitrophota bacterium]|jgi:competence protein ComEC
MKQPLIGLSLAFCSGIISAVYLKIPFSALCLLTFLSLVSALVFLRQIKKSSLFILATVFFLGAVLLRNSQTLPDCHIARLAPYKSENLPVIGVIDNDPAYQGKNIFFVLKVERIETAGFWQKACGRVLVRVFRKGDFSYGNRVFLKGNLSRPVSFSKAKFNYRDYLRRRGIYFILSVKKKNLVKRLEQDRGNPISSLAFRARRKMKDIIARNLSPFSAGILNAVILGERQGLPIYIRDSLMKSGTVHIIAISGLHLGIASFIILLILKIIKVPRKPRYILTILLLIFYCIITGAKLPVVRATAMASALLSAYFLKREIDIYNSLSIAALIILWINPWQLFEVSFQLSFLSVLSIVWLSPKIKSVFPVKLEKIPWARFLILAFSVSSAAWLGLLPLTAYYFRIFSPVTVLANMIIVPYMTIIVASGFSLVLIGILIPCLSYISAASNELFILILFKINSLLVAIPGAYLKLPEISFACVLFYYLLLILIFNFSKIPAMLQIIQGKTRYPEVKKEAGESVL